MRRTRAHNAYKPTATAWLPQIPAHWDLRSFRRMTREVNRRNDDGNSGPMLSLSAYRGVELKEWEFAEQARLQEDSLTYKVVAPYQLVVNPMWCINGAVAVSYLDGIVSPAYRIYTLQAGLRPRFADYLFRSHFYVKEYNLHVRGSTTYDRSVRKEAFNRLPVVIPPEQEQDDIVAFLEAKERDIQSFIANKRRTIELLEEQKAAVITLATTRGLKPNLPTKATSIPWLAEIPQHWKPIPLKHLAQVHTGVTLGASYGGAALKTYPYIRVANVQSGYLDLTEIKTVDVPESEARACKLEPGDVLMTEGGDFDKLGRGHIWEGQIADCLHQNHIFAVRTDRRRLMPEFLAAQLTSHHAKTYFTLTSKKTTNLASTNKSKLGMLLVLLPPLAEQETILHRIKEQNTEIAAAIAAAEREIALMGEYRTALITAAVTGKIDVRQGHALKPPPS